MGGMGMGMGMQCPPGMEQDGSCQYFSFCIDPKEHCFNGACCQPSKLGSIMPGPGGMPVVGSPFCPPGMYPDGGCSVMKFCFDPKEQCIGNYCCQQEQGMNGMMGMGGYGMPGMYGGMGGYGGGMMSPYGMSGGMGCMDTQPGCMMFMMYCGVETILEACLMTCGVCHGGMGMGMGMYG
ncbi:hypothetical protein Ddc_14742 [Ditylenchus destructor]|nr:hypothetical protein Ddc_14742 [Ditylenchus destructor]